MTDPLAVFLALLFSLIAAALLYDGVSGSSGNQTAKIIGGSMFLALALTMTWGVLKNWWELREIRKSYHRERESWR
jgi:high-affinity Fe2+/Pb2+ permease